MQKLVAVLLIVLTTSLIIPTHAFAINWEGSSKIGYLPKKTYDQIAKEKIDKKFRFRFAGSFGAGQVFFDGYMSIGRNYSSTISGESQYAINWETKNTCLNAKMPMRVYDKNDNALQFFLDGKVCKTKIPTVKKYNGQFTILKGENKLMGTTGYGNFIINSNLNSHYISGVFYGNIDLPKHK